jgi:hypothetical protein
MMVGGIEPGLLFTPSCWAGARSGRHLIHVYDTVWTLVGITGGQPVSIYLIDRAGRWPLGDERGW